ncbi:hypothetical protein [Lentzea flava]|uniref:Uncharacterized protein n=1 Tax=Lentzea flava TaxID=103732 RepID=A0ABQ2VEG4_9PSEU|nr:hypothetical protein [Lentzea flava]MCP2205050.1 hypothetical protein [Lentzea flava]GGU82917.1 hypothetical protein GCM10010178_86710 [Lentzea flava]
MLPADFAASAARQATGQDRVITPRQPLAKPRESDGDTFVSFNPMMGGNRRNWRQCLHLFESDVLPHLCTLTRLVGVPMRSPT